MGMYYSGYGKKEEESLVDPMPKKQVEQQWCVRCAMNTLIRMCWYLFQRDHDTCDVWVCYRCRVRLHESTGRWYDHESVWIHDEFGYGDKV